MCRNEIRFTCLLLSELTLMIAAFLESSQIILLTTSSQAWRQIPHSTQCVYTSISSFWKSVLLCLPALSWYSKILLILSYLRAKTIWASLHTAESLAHHVSHSTFNLQAVKMVYDWKILLIYGCHKSSKGDLIWTKNLQFTRMTWMRVKLRFKCKSHYSCPLWPYRDCDGWPYICSWHLEIGIPVT